MNTVLPRAGLPASRRSNLPTIPSPTTSRRPGSPVWFRFPGLPPRSPLGRRTHFRRVPLGVCRASPLTCRLATTSGRIEFVILRTGRSPPVALHLASRQRSCLQLTGSDLTCARTCTPLVRRACRRTRRRYAALRFVAKLPWAAPTAKRRRRCAATIRDRRTSFSKIALPHRRPSPTS